MIILMMSVLFTGCKSTEEKTEVTAQESSDTADQVEDEKSNNQNIINKMPIKRKSNRGRNDER